MNQEEPCRWTVAFRCPGPETRRQALQSSLFTACRCIWAGLTTPALQYLPATALTKHSEPLGTLKSLSCNIDQQFLHLTGKLLQLACRCCRTETRVQVEKRVSPPVGLAPLRLAPGLTYHGVCPRRARMPVRHILQDIQSHFSAAEASDIVLFCFATVAIVAFAVMLVTNWRRIPREADLPMILKEVTILKERSSPAPKQTRAERQG